MVRTFLPGLILLFLAAPAAGQGRVLDAGTHHLRNGEPREWAAFPERAEGPDLTLRFQAAASEGVHTLRLRQEDVKQSWTVSLNGQELGGLHLDENRTAAYYTVPEGALREGENTLRIETRSNVPDDIRVGAVTLFQGAPEDVLSQARVEVRVADAESGRPLPSRITVVDAAGALQTVGASSSASLAVRPGVVYTGTGTAAFGLPEGTYTVYAGRGFEYGVDSVRITVRPGDHVRHALTIRREVPAPGYVSMDTHIHTLTHSGHGDATALDRMLTLAGEGIELAIATEHNQHVTFDASAGSAGVRQYFTPVVGNEVTTSIGHFNVFPADLSARVPDHRPMTWDSIFTGIFNTPDVRAVILNHARDLHRGYRVFGPENHRAVAGENVRGWRLRANAMEVINSGAQQTDPMRLIHDWMGMLNRGHILTPVGSSDSHDVSRFIVGQGRTYVQARDDNPGRIDVDEAVSHFVEGRVMVSLGLLAELTVDERYGPGDLVTGSDPVTVRLRVLGPGWTEADRVELYANGRRIQEAAVASGEEPGVKADITWRLPRPEHDVFLTAVATGPGVTALYWPIAKPYQPTSPEWEPYVLGLSGAVWIDGDGDGRRSSAFDYARTLVSAAGGNVPALMQRLAAYDVAVAVQAASLLAADGLPPADPRISAALQDAAPTVREGFEAYRQAWEASQPGSR